MSRAVKLNNGASLPTVGLGTWQSKEGEVRNAIKAAIAAGYRHIDCASNYMNEHEIGDALAEVVCPPPVTCDVNLLFPDIRRGPR